MDIACLKADTFCLLKLALRQDCCSFTTIFLINYMISRERFAHIIFRNVDSGLQQLYI